ncbi:hypothetical protein CRUP_015934 [Coryphaenoides rupestris]|nr:hypothetical protein CRUP_015934 [Coryphaenoides rupestris]
MNLELLQKEKSVERVVYKEVVRVEKDPTVEAERDHLRELVVQERHFRRDQEDNIQSLKSKFIRLQTLRSTSSTEETSLTLSQDTLQKEKDNLLMELRTLESERQTVSTTFHQQSKIVSERNQISRQRSVKVQTEMQRLERDLLNEKDKIHHKETFILELQKSLKKEESQTETHTRETNLSTRISILDPETAIRLLEAQAASGGIVDLNKKDKISVHKAAQIGLIETGHMHKLLHAQKAFTGVEDPETKERLSACQAAEKGWIPQDSAMRYMQAQYFTGGLVDPSKTGRLTVEEALATNMIDEEAAKSLKDEASFPAELLDPITKEMITYRQAMDRCHKDVTTGLLLLPAISTEGNTPSYSNYRFNTTHSQGGKGGAARLGAWRPRLHRCHGLTAPPTCPVNTAILGLLIADPAPEPPALSVGHHYPRLPSQDGNSAGWLVGGPDPLAWTWG